ncbi:MAG: hypothetical protein UY41_C0040G0008 [Candidatus Moranbacteria bacterium GW2011_GWE1_49_15]|nr:MAG: hypothetical protein UY41_C0040G0008 [Candidatus Moranbacteria bacterium GW2011_GWE1_49_15]
MVEVPKVAHLMDDHIIRQIRAYLDQGIIEIKVSVAAATPPKRLLVPDRNPIEFEIIELVEMGYPLLDQLPGRLLEF